MSRGWNEDGVLFKKNTDILRQLITDNSKTQIQSHVLINLGFRDIYLTLRTAMMVSTLDDLINYPYYQRFPMIMKLYKFWTVLLRYRR